MSGGVDSSVAAALLVEQGYEVIGMMLRLWSEPDQETNNKCCTPDAMADARRAAALLDIPFYAVDARTEFYDTVVDYFIEAHKNNVTPNPCLICNRLIRWELLYNKAISLGAAYFSTGHYARIVKGKAGIFTLQKALDRRKDQSYVLHTLNQEKLSRTLFPLGRLSKSDVREIARDMNLPASERPDSQDLCFIGEGDYRDFLMRNAPQVIDPGAIYNMGGRQLGQHKGLPFYTIGQRKGIGISGPTPYYVVDKDKESNALIVGTIDELGENGLTARDVNWISGKSPVSAIRAQIKIRYRAKEIPGIITPLQDNRVKIHFDTQLRDITPGQAAVFYQDEICLGGGIIL